MTRLAPRLIPVVCALALTTAPAVLAAQAPPEAGTRVRVTLADGGVVVGDFVRTTRDTLWVAQPQPGTPAAIPATEVELLETRRGFDVAVLGLQVAAFGLGGGVLGLATRDLLQFGTPPSRGAAFRSNALKWAAIGLPLAIYNAKGGWTPLEEWVPGGGNVVIHPVVGARTGIEISIPFVGR